MSLLDPSELPQVDPDGDSQGSIEDSTIVALTTLGLRLSTACRHAHKEQGVSILDLVWMLHGIMGQVLSWSFSKR